jgi:diguanylate cyclase (GGDEF)-like protein
VTSDDGGPGTASPDGGDRLLSALSSVREIADARARTASASRGDRFSALGLGFGYLTVAVGCATAADLPSLRDLVFIVALVVLYAVAYRTEFVAPGGCTVPTEPVLVGLLLVTPLPLVPLAVLAALQIGSAGAQEPGRLAKRLVVRMISGWHCLGPVAVLWLLPVGRPDLDAWPIYLLALLAQFGFDAGSAVVRSAALGIPPRRLVAPLRWTFTVDALLAPLGLCVVIATVDTPAAVVLLAAPIGLIRLLARDRSEQLETAVALGTAFSAVNQEARVDVLTGLANRRAWVEAIEAAELRARVEGLVAIVLIADVDGLKRVNDTFGHDAGDELIQSVGRVIADAAPARAVAARLGGDEFGLLLLAAAGSALPDTLGPMVRAALQRHPGVRGMPLSASLGVASCPPADSVLDAVSFADLSAAEDKVLRRAGRT